MADGDVEVESAPAFQVLPKDVTAEIGTIKLFNKWSYEDVEIRDISLTDYIQIRQPVYISHSAGRYAVKRFRKAQCPIIERLTNSLMMNGRNNGKKLMAVRIVAHAFEIIHIMTDQNPIQVAVDAIVNCGPREDSTRIGSAGTVRRQAVDVSPLRRVNQAIALLTIGAREAAFRNIKSVAECLAEELINAAKGSSNSYAIKKKDELERVAKNPLHDSHQNHRQFRSIHNLALINKLVKVSRSSKTLVKLSPGRYRSLQKITKDTTRRVEEFQALTTGQKRENKVKAKSTSKLLHSLKKAVSVDRETSAKPRPVLSTYTGSKYNLPSDQYAKAVGLLDLLLSPARQYMLARQIGRQLWPNLKPSVLTTRLNSTETQSLIIAEHAEEQGIYWRAITMKAYAQVISTPTVDTPGTTILLQFENKRYLIGRMFEGVQRNNVQMSVRYLKISELFMSGRCEWQSTGGVVGYVLSHADATGASLVSRLEAAKTRAQAHAAKQGFSNDQAKVDELVKKFTVSDTPKLDIFAPPNFTYQLATNRRYILRKGMPITVHEIDTNTKPLTPETSDPKVYWSDQNVKVYAMPIESSTSSEQYSRPANGRKRSYEEIDSDKAMNGTLIRALLRTR
ncbi:hypothetical protein MRB53_040024 [Persea americana]|nr:hypothetical protein MRB53_040024 [Persea americana]